MRKNADLDVAFDGAFVVGRVPRDFHTALLIVVDCLGASGGMNRDATAAGDEADDTVAGKWVAAASEADQYVVEIGDDDRVARFTAFAGRGENFLEKALVLFSGVLKLALERFLRDEIRNHMLDFFTAVAQENIELVRSAQVVFLGDFEHFIALFEFAQIEAVISERLLEHFAPEFHRARAFLLLDEGADFGLGARALDDLEPVFGWRLSRRGDDLDRVSGFEPVLQRDDLAVDLRADAFVADVGVDGIGEIERRRTMGELSHFAFRSEDEYVFGKKVDLDGFEKFVRILKFFVPLEQALDPLDVFVAIANRICLLCISSARRCRPRRPDACPGSGSGSRRARHEGR